MKFFDLFCGIGGFRLGLERNGHECIGSCEIDRFAREIYAKNFGRQPEFNDVRELDTQRIGDFDILTAGFPCQAFSFAGQRLGFADTRGTLFFEIARIAAKVRPKILFLENVKGLLNHDEGRTYTTILTTLHELGYDVEWQVINGKYFVPQSRERVFIIGHLRNKPTRKIFPLEEGITGNDQSLSQTPEERERVRSTHTRTIDSNYYKGGHGSMIKVVDCNSARQRVYDPEGLSPTLVTPTGGESQPKIIVLKEVRSEESKELRKVGIDKRQNKTLVPRDDGLVGCLTAQQEKWSKHVIVPYMFANTKANGRRWKTDGEPSFTLSTSNDSGVYDGMRIRKLTPLECERLMGFPDGWTEGMSDTQRYKMLGNSVIVPVIELIGSKLE